VKKKAPHQQMPASKKQCCTNQPTNQLNATRNSNSPQKKGKKKKRKLYNFLVVVVVVVVVALDTHQIKLYSYSLV
jgi:hypothetical protein